MIIKYFRPPNDNSISRPFITIIVAQIWGNFKDRYMIFAHDICLPWADKTKKITQMLIIYLIIHLSYKSYVLKVYLNLPFKVCLS